jgi:hypothetical protein
MGSKMASQATTTPSMLLALQATEAPQQRELSHGLARASLLTPIMTFFTPATAQDLWLNTYFQ